MQGEGFVGIADRGVEIAGVVALFDGEGQVSFGEEVIRGTLADTTRLRMVLEILSSELQILDGEFVGLLPGGPGDVEFERGIGLVDDEPAAVHLGEPQINEASEESQLGLIVVSVSLGDLKGFYFQAVKTQVGGSCHPRPEAVGGIPERIAGGRPIGEVAFPTFIPAVHDVRTPAEPDGIFTVISKAYTHVTGRDAVVNLTR